MEDIKVSIIIPNYNHRRFLDKRLQSILNQSYQNFELILLDDNSNDNSQQLLKSFENHDKVKTLLLNTKNSGSAFKQWYKGLEQASGDLIWIAESDDFASPNFLATAVKQFQANRNLSLFFTNSQQVDEQNSVINRNTINYTEPFKKYDWTQDFTVDGIDFINDVLLFRNVIQNASGVVYKNRKNLLKNLKQSESYYYCGDWLFWVNLLSENGAIYYNAKPLNFFRYSKQSTRNHFNLDIKKKRLSEELKLIHNFESKLNLSRRQLFDLEFSVFNRWLSANSRKNWFSKEVIRFIRQAKSMNLIKFYLRYFNKRIFS